MVVFPESGFSPEIQAIDIAVREIKRPLMRLERRCLRITRRGIVANWKWTADHGSVGGLQRHKVRLGYIRAEIVRRERLASDEDFYVVLVLFYFDRSRQ